MFRAARLMVALALPPAVVGGQTTIELLPCGELPQAETQLAVVAEGPADAEGSAPSVEASTLAPGSYRHTLDLEAGRQWSLFLASEAFWAHEGIALDSSDRRTVQLPVWPRSTLVGRLAVPQGATLPGELALRLHPVAVDEDSASHRECRLESAFSTCPVGDEGDFRCSVPAGRWNLVIKAHGWAARHFWDLGVAAQEEVTVGEVRLRHGATLIGHVVTIDGRPDPKRTRVLVEPDTGDPALRPTNRREHGQTATIDDQGLFVFEDLTPGRYEVVARQPGYSPRRIYPVDVVENHETALREPMVLGPLVELLGTVSPASPSTGGPWKVEVHRAHAGGGSEELVGATETDEEGAWVLSSLHSGSYFVKVTDRRGDAWLREGPVVLDLDDEVYLHLEVGVVPARGVVLLGREPLAATLAFRGEAGTLDLETDEEGRIEAHLPEGGEWLVDVTATDPPVSYSAYEIQIPHDGGEFEIRLPSTELRGTVRTEEGEIPPQTTWVRLALMDGVRESFTVEAEADGSFAIHGVLPGLYAVEARSGELQSDVSTVHLAEELTPPDVHLVLRRRERVEGFVVSAHGGLPGVEVEAFPLGPSGQMVGPGYASAVTDAAGRFELEVPRGTERLLLSARAPGFALTIEYLELTDGPLRVEVGAPEGVLRLVRSQGDGTEPGVTDTHDLVLMDGKPVMGIELERWAQMNGAPVSGTILVVPAMPSGVYQFCRVTLHEALAVVSGLALPTSCSHGVLVPGVELELVLPAP